MTEEKYRTVLLAYQDNETELMSKLKSTTTTKFNDTPQNVGKFTGDSYTSTITNVSTEVDPAPIINRLSDIQNKYQMVLKEWAKEFIGLFGESLLY